MQAKLKLEIVPEGMWTAGEGADLFDYANEGWEGDSPLLEKAAAWLGLSTDSPSR
ncbi:hypothetical protein GCM10028796_50930 [Ramlibacter monticola]|uniref:Uncharacterized protein n=1 Tax=Ramlibacter monticola TaxID=1926872 RepID=A0A937CZV2_9BURK|nr:hypothetical protein [Ramlibacter monticola]MBL0395297.1 hypothetical protein [Ramlibacter monticola]